MNGHSLGVQAIVDEDAEQNSDSSYFTVNDLNGEPEVPSTAVISLNGSSARVTGQNAYVYNENVIITDSGFFVISGTLDNGSIIVDAHSSSKVWLVFAGAEISCSDDACIQILQADKVFLTLREGTENTLSCGEVFSDEALEAGHDGAVFASDDLTINGSGSLTITAGYEHGIEANDDLVITGGTISIDAPKDAINVNDSFRICLADLTLTAGDDGIAVKNEDGYFYMESGSLTITSTGDAVHTVGDVTIAGGDITISTEDDGIHSDSRITILDGTLLINKCYEGLEALQIDMYGADVTIYPQDDGFNASGGTNLFGMQGGFGQMTGGPGQMADAPAQEDASVPVPESSDSSSTEETDSSSWIHISGGNVLIVNDQGQDADGLDSNGDIIITGGTIYVSLTNSGSNNAIDYGSEYGGTAEIHGGTIIACGSSAMAEAFGSSSTQPSILYSISEGVEAGSTVELKDEEGNVLSFWTVPCSFSSISLSLPEMIIGNTYTIVTGDNAETITLNEVSTSFGDARNSMFGGTFNMGGMQMHDGRGGRNGTQMQGMDGRNDMQIQGTDGRNGMQMQGTDGRIGMQMQGTDGRIGMQMQGTDGSGSQDNMPENTAAGNTDVMSDETSSSSAMPSNPGEMPADFPNSSMPQKPGGPGEMPDGTDFQMSSPGENPFEISYSDADEAAKSDEETAVIYPENTWLLVGISALVLLAAIIVVYFIKKRR